MSDAGSGARARGAPEVEVDLDDPALDGRPGSAGRSPPDPRRARVLVVALGLAVASLALADAFADRAQRAQESQVLLEATGGGLLAARGPASTDRATLAALEVEIANAGTTRTTLVAVRADGAGSRLVDDLRGSGGEARALEQGTGLAPGDSRSVVLSGVVACPVGGQPPVVTEGLVVEARAADGTPRTVRVAAPDDPEWAGALAEACGLHPAGRGAAGRLAR